MRISDWSSDVCSSDLRIAARLGDHALQHLLRIHLPAIIEDAEQDQQKDRRGQREFDERGAALAATQPAEQGTDAGHCDSLSLEICRAIAWNCSLSRSDEHTSELQSLMRISYAVFCLKKKTKKNNQHQPSKIIDKTNKNHTAQ